MREKEMMMREMMRERDDKKVMVIQRDDEKVMMRER